MGDPKLTNIDCVVALGEGVDSFGEFANAFRVLPESQTESFMDFCVYSAQENKAKIVSRIRVHNSFLQIIMTRLQELNPGSIEIKDGRLQTTDGRMVFLGPPCDEN